MRTAIAPAARRRRAPDFDTLLGLLLAPLAFGCGALEPVGETGGEGEGAVPAVVVQAFAESCAGGGCHDAATRAGGLSLAESDLAAVIGGPSSSGLPMVEIGDIANSYLAIKMLPDDVISAQGLMRSGGRMPPTGDFTNPNNQTILAWIAGAEFPDDGGTGSTGGTDTDTTDGGALTFDAAIWPILQMRCSCHLAGADEALNGMLSFPMDTAYDNLVGAPSIDVPAMNLIEPNDAANSYLLHKVKGTQADVGGAGVQMPTGGMLDDADIQTIEDWIAAGAPM
jgi:hypothetical protein